MRNLFSMFGGVSYSPPKGDSRRASYSAVPRDRGATGRRQSYSTNRRQSLDPAAVLGRHLFDGRLADPRTRNICLISLLLIGFSALVLGTLIAIFDPYQLILNWKLILAKGDESYEMWKTPDAKVYLKVFIFNVTNHEDFLSGKDEKLKFEEVGPYIYRENSSHENATFNDNNTMSITPIFPLTWVPEMNKGREDDLFILPNIALLSFASVMSDASIITRMAVNLLIRQTKSQPFIQQTAKEFMFGYESALVTIGNKFLPSWIAFDKLGLIDRMYEFTGDSATIYTGADNVAKSGLIENYNRRPYLPQWPSAPCNIVNGASDGVKFPSLMTPDFSPTFFRKSLCRSLPMVRVSEEFIYEGLPVYEYKFKNGTMDNGAENIENKCFCRKNRCMKSGLLDITDCYYGFPIALSYPHFFNADQSLINTIEGVHPEKDKHESFFYINPLSGLPTKLYVRMQINLAMGDVSNMANTERCSNIVLPLVWTEIGFEKLPDYMLTKFFVYLRVGPVFFMTIQYALLIGGVAFVALTVISSLFIPVDDEMRYSNSSAWRRESQTLTGHHPSTPKTVHVPIPVAAGGSVPAKEMNTYYNSLLNGEDGGDGGVAAVKLNKDLCGRLEVLHEVRSYDTSAAAASCTESEYDDEDDENDRIIV